MFISSDNDEIYKSSKFTMRSLYRFSLSVAYQSRIFYFNSYRKLADKIQEISQIGSHIEKRQIFLHYISSINSGDKQSVINILNFIEKKPKTNIAAKSLCQYVSQRFQVQDIGELDIDKLAEEVWKKCEQKSNNDEKGGIKLKEVEQILEKLKTIQGKGSKQTKLKLIEDFIRKAASQIEILVFLKIVTKNLRMGAKDKMINFNQIAENREQSIEQVSKMQFEPMLAKPLKNLEEFEKFCNKKESEYLLADLKYDGERSMIVFKRGDKLRMISRRNRQQAQIYEPFANLLTQELQKVEGLQSIKLDGEIVLVGPNQQPLPMQRLLNQRGKDKFVYENDQKMLFYAFDVLEYNGQELIDLPLKQRVPKIIQTPTIHKSVSKPFKYPAQKEQLINFFIEVLQKKFEGLIIKGSEDKYYTNGSRRHWGKLKRGCKIHEKDTQSIDLDLVVMGVDQGQGKRSNLFGSFYLGVYHQGNYYPVSKVGTGFTEQQLLELSNTFCKKITNEKPSNYIMTKYVKPKYFVPPEIVFEVNCQEISRSSIYNFSFKPEYGGLSLRFPVFARIRDDKSAQDCNGDVLIELAQQ